MQNEELMTEVAQALVQDADTMDDLANDIADKLQDELDNSPELRTKVVDAAVANPDFKKRVVAKLIDELS